MNSSSMVPSLASPVAEGWLKELGLENLERARGNLEALAQASPSPQVFAALRTQLAEQLPKLSDPDRALHNLERFVAATSTPAVTLEELARDREGLTLLLQFCAMSQYLADQLVREPENFAWLRSTQGQPLAREVLVEDLAQQTESLTEERELMLALRRFKHRETLRIAYGDIIRGQPVETVTKQISFLAEAICEAALAFAWRRLAVDRGVPRLAGGREARFTVLALGKLGGQELNYSSDIDLIFLYEGDGNTDGRRKITNQEFFDRLAREFLKLLTTPTELNQCYRVDMRLRPQGAHGPLVVSLEAALHYYDVLGRTWERQAFVKARPVAGNLEFGASFLSQLTPWVYRRYLARADITGIKALKRRIEQRAALEGGDLANVKTGHGGIRDIEFVIQFLQLLNGGDLPEVRAGNTLAAIAGLEQVGCLTMQERTILSENYAMLRKVEHRLQLMFDLQTHTLPADERELSRLAFRTGYPGASRAEVLAAFQQDFASRTAENRKILDHLLHDAFSDAEETDPEVDLVLDPDPSAATIHDLLSRHGLKDTQSAYQNLMALASENIPFLSTRRCRHFLASIAPRLLGSIASTPDPDATLMNLSRVSDSLGGKGVLWELFSFNPPSLKLYVRLCAACPYLSQILVSHPGMIDELMDSLVLDRLPTFETLDATLGELCRGAEDIEPILHSFKNANHLRVGIRDILGKADVYMAHGALADIAEACVRQVAQSTYWRLAERYGEPLVGDGPRAGQPSEFMILALGKLGGREPNYHSDLDLIFLYEAEGATRHRIRRGDSTSNQHFFTEWGQRIVRTLTQLGPYGRLYEVDPRLRPTGKSGSLAISVSELARYFREGEGQLWERQALCKVRPIFGDVEACSRTMSVVREIITGPAWRPQNVAEIRDMRRRLEQTATKQNIKRGPGGTMDIEFAAQMLQLKHAHASPDLLTPGTLDLLAALHKHKLLSDDDFQFFTRSYRYLRSVESGLRLMNTVARHDLPTAPAELHKLAYLLRQEGPAYLEDECQYFREQNRHRFERIFAAAEKG